MSGKKVEINCVWQGPNALGEGPLWHSGEQALYWLDLVRNTLHRLDANHLSREWQLPGQVGAVVPHFPHGLIATLDNSIVSITLPTLKMTSIAKIPPWPSDVIRDRDGSHLIDAMCC